MNVIPYSSDLYLRLFTLVVIVVYFSCLCSCGILSSKLKDVQFFEMEYIGDEEQTPDELKLKDIQMSEIENKGDEKTLEDLKP